MWKKHTDVSSVLALVKIVVASQHKRQRKKYLCQDLLMIENKDSDLKASARSALIHYANELLLRVRLTFQKLLQTRQTSRNYKKQVLVMIKHCLGNSQINSIPAWSKEFSYITFLYRTLAKVNALARADITSIHSQREIKEIFDLKTHPFIN